MTGDNESHGGGDISSLLEVDRIAQDSPSAADSKTKDKEILAELVRLNMKKSRLRREALNLRRRQFRESASVQVQTSTQQKRTIEVRPGRRRVRPFPGPGLGLGLSLGLCMLSFHVDLIYFVLLRAGPAVVV